MDIRRWLEETVQPEHLSSLPGNTIAASFCHKKPGPTTSKRHRREQSKSDSSLLDPPLREKPPTRKQKRTAEASTDHSAGSEASHPTHSETTESDVSSHRYARRPRRKTHPERYEPSSKAVKERGKHAYRSRKGESNKSQRKSKRKKCEKACSGTVQCFHAKNVSGDRLTLKPREQLGLFNKGKTSMAVKGRGLPDLVFSEMKFLQQQKDQPELIPEAEPPKKKRKSNYTHTKEDEISAFFTSVRPVLAEKDGNIQAKGTSRTHDTSLELRHRERGRSSLAVEDATPTVPTIEVSDKASYLGFGSRGPRHESTSVVSWSDSTREPSTKPALARTKHVLYFRRLDSINPGEHGKTTDKQDVSFKRPAPLSSGPRRTNGTSERFEVSSLAPSRQRVSRSQSHPRYTSSPRRVNLVDRAAKFRSTDTIDSPSSMPPVAPVHAAAIDARQVQVADEYNASKFRAASIASPGASSTYRQPTLDGEDTDAGFNPQTSSDLGRVIQKCNSTFHERRRAATPQRRHPMPEILSRFADEAESQSSRGFMLYPANHRTPIVRFAGVENRAPPLTSLAGPSIYEQQAQRQQLPLQPMAEENFLQDTDIAQECFDETEDMGCGTQNWEESPEDGSSWSPFEVPWSFAGACPMQTVGSDVRHGGAPRPLLPAGQPHYEIFRQF
ncbi:hypothetical protein N0V83_003978 [Neocucurbitaria cava]|uniref:Uncharacterized protein n=1 Tax=Neocucurbitaria cava TaxID=798079 RepID=A0A9W9CNN8_9PLEO|nr:hypothetical protein N0V83_003978 [Neocucurbitaria cava]